MNSKITFLFIMSFNYFFSQIDRVLSSYLNVRPSFDESEFLDGAQRNHVPTLENLFQKTSYWDINNITSPCKYHDYKRYVLCQKVILFDKEGYEKSLQDTRKLFLGRLGN